MRTILRARLALWCAYCIHENKYSEHEEVRIHCMSFKYVLSNG